MDSESNKTFSVMNPATQEIIGEAPLGDKADVDRAVVSAQKAFSLWADMSQSDFSFPSIPRPRIQCKASDASNLDYPNSMGCLMVH